MEDTYLRKLLLVLCLTLFVGAAAATPMVVDFNSYTPLNTQSTVITWQGLTCTQNIGAFMYVWDGSSPNGNGTPALIFAGFGSGGSVTITNAMGGSFNLLSAAMTISTFDSCATASFISKPAVPEAS